MPKQCFSKCRKLSRNKCGPNICKYVNGSKYSYCRLSQKYKLNGKCEITKKRKRPKTKSKNQSRREIKEFILTKRRNKQNVITNKTRKAKQLATFIYKNKYNIKKEYLKAICNDSGVCLNFGKEGYKIKDFFDNFTKLTYAKSPIKQIGNDSVNGFVNEITYERKGYKAYSILKSSRSDNADNLYYEYLVGMYINTLVKRFPTFLETYGIFQYSNSNDWNKLSGNKTTSINTINKSLIDLSKRSKSAFENNQVSEIFELLSDSCTYSKYLSIMIQHIKNSNSLRDIYVNNSNNYLCSFYDQELPQIIFQIYFTLSCLADTFTHYDLHDSNVMLYVPIPDGYIQYHYTMPNGEIISFKSKYVVKIIDYGRCYFKYTDDNNSKTIYTQLCKINKRKQNCCVNKGYEWLKEEDGQAKTKTYIVSQKKNKSHDLRLLTILVEHLLDVEKSYNTKYYECFQHMLTNFKTVKYKALYGTNNINKNKYPSEIANVHDALFYCKDLIKTECFRRTNNAVYETNINNTKRIVELSVFSNGDDIKIKL